MNGSRDVRRVVGRPRFLVRIDPASGPSLPGVQGLRALAAASILTWHVWAHSSATYAQGPDFGVVSRYLFVHLPLGVTLLFVLSAFLLYRPFAAAIIRGSERPKLSRYLVNRAARILPAYWAILLVTVFLLQSALVRAEDGSLEPGALHQEPRAFVLNLLLLQGFHPDTLLTGIGPAWALTAVVTFYASLPALVLAAVALATLMPTRKGRTIAAVVPAAILILVGIAGSATATFVVPGGSAGGWGADWHSVVERSFFAHAEAFAFGLVVAVAHVVRQDGGLRLPRRWRPAALITVIVTGGVTAKFTTAEGQLSVFDPANYVYDGMMAAVVALFLAWVLLPDSDETQLRPTTRLLESRPLVSVGIVSYSIFLWHEPLILKAKMAGLTTGSRAGFFVIFAGIATATFLLSALTYRYLELPALMRKRQTVREIGSAPRLSVLDRCCQILRLPQHLKRYASAGLSPDAVGTAVEDPRLAELSGSVGLARTPRRAADSGRDHSREGVAN
jgi:peptidoglycan/LPS O-acetylase OafA/YrhL